MSSKLTDLVESIFRHDYYVSKNSFEGKDVDTIKHFFDIGQYEGQTFNPLFDPSWYAHVNNQTGTTLELFQAYLNADNKDQISTHPLINRSYIAAQNKYSDSKDTVLDFIKDASCYTHRNSSTVSPSIFFDCKYYLEVNGDVADNGIHPLMHYIIYGWSEYRNPNPYFNTEWYLNRYPDIKLADVNPLIHYAMSGLNEGRQPHHLFDPAYYLAGAPDVAEQLVNPWIHYVTFGDAEGRSGHPLFVPHFYRAQHKSRVIERPFAHYSAHASYSNKSPCPAFDINHYRTLYPEFLTVNSEPLLDYILAPLGWRRHFHPLIDGDVQRISSLRDYSQTDPLVEYVQFRSNFRPLDVSLGETSIPKPKRALLPNRDLEYLDIDDLKGSVAIIVPCYKSNLNYLNQCIQSVKSQTYCNWNLILIDDCSEDRNLADFLQQESIKDDRIFIYSNKINLGISAATNLGVEMSQSDYIALLDHDDVLVPSALAKMVSAIEAFDADISYSDQAYRTIYDNVDETFYKPGWSPTLFTGVMYIGHLLIYKRELSRKVGHFKSEYDGCQDYEYMLRLSEVTKKIVHVPEILYHWRRAETSIAANAGVKGRIELIQAKAVNSHFERLGIQSLAEPIPDLTHRLRIMPIHTTNSHQVDVVLYSDQLDSSEYDISHLKLGRHRLGKVYIVSPNDISSVNMQDSESPFILFMNKNISIEKDDYLSFLMMYALQSDIAFAAPILSDPAGVVYASGYIASKNHGMVPAYRGYLQGDDGHIGTLACDREVSIVSGNCALVRRSALNKIGGLDTSFSSIHGAIADASYRAGLEGLRNINVATKLVSIPSEEKIFGLIERADETIFREKHAALLAKGDVFYISAFVDSPANFSSM